MNPNRRDFIKFIVSGSVAAGCPVDLALVAGGRAGTDGPGRPEVDGEDNEICLELSFKERDPTDRQVIADIAESVAFWAPHIDNGAADLRG